MAANVPQKGNEFQIWFDSSIVGYGSKYSFDAGKPTIEITNLSSGGYKEFMSSGVKEWKVSFDGMMIKTSFDVSRGYDFLMNSLITVDSSVTVCLKPTTTGNTYYTGAGLLTAIKWSGDAKGDAITYSAEVQGTGALTKLTS